MSKVDDELTRRFRRAERPVETDDLVEGLARRRHRRRTLQRVQAGALAIAVLAATAGGFIALSRTFSGERPDGSGVTPVPIVPKANGLLVFADGTSLYTIPPTGGEPTRISGIPNGTWLPAWSPDGSRLAFAVFPNGPRELWVADADGSNATKLTEADNVSQPDWSPDGSTIAYAADTGGESAIHVVNSDGSGDRVVGEVLVGPDYFSASFSPDGTKILYDKGTDSGFGIFVMDADGTNVTRLSEGDTDYAPAWSPDASQIVFTRQEVGAESDIFVMRADGSSVRRLTDGPSGDTNLYPTFSPDGTQIAFVSGRQGGPGGIVVMDADGGDPRTLVADDVLGIAWQPLPVGSEASPTASPEPSVSPGAEPEGKDVGLGFNLCDSERLGAIDFLGNGSGGVAWIGVPTNDDGTCPRYSRPGKYVVAEDHTADGAADSWLDLPWQCYVDCVPFDATDLDGNGTEELIVASYFSIMDYYVMGLKQNHQGALEIRPFLVAEPGHDAAGIAAGDPLRIDAGGDAGYGSAIWCEGYPEAPVIVWAWVFGAIETNRPQEVHITRIQLQSDGLFHVVGTNDYTIPASEYWGYGDQTAPACGVDWNPAP